VKAVLPDGDESCLSRTTVIIDQYAEGRAIAQDRCDHRGGATAISGVRSLARRAKSQRIGTEARHELENTDRWRLPGDRSRCLRADDEARVKTFGYEMSAWLLNRV
jgi:hypothetical protein